MDTTWEDFDNEYEDDTDDVADFERATPKGEHRIGVATFGLMMGVAFFFDFIQFILLFLGIGAFFGFIVGGTAWLTFFLWFTIKGVPFIWGGRTTKKVGKRLGAIAAETIPLPVIGGIIGAIPWLSLTVYSMCSDARKEDKKYA